MINDRIVLNVQQPPFYKKEYIYKNEQMVWNAFNTLTDENGISLANGLPLRQQEMENILTALGENGTRIFSSGNGTFPSWAKIGEGSSNGDIWGTANTSNIGAIRYKTYGGESLDFGGKTEAVFQAECRAGKAANLINKDVWPVYESYSASSLKTNSGSTTQNQRKCFYFLNYFNYCLQKGTDGKYPNLYAYRRRINEEKIDWILSLTGIFNKLESKMGTIKFQFYKQNIDNLFWETEEIDLNDSNLIIESNLLTYTFSNKNLTFQKNNVYRVIILYTDVVENISQSNYALIKCEDYGVNGKINIEDNNFSISSYSSPVSQVKINKEYSNDNNLSNFNGLGNQNFQQISQKNKYETINFDKLIKRQFVYEVKPFSYGEKVDVSKVLFNFDQNNENIVLDANGTAGYITYFEPLKLRTDEDHKGKNCLLLNGCSINTSNTGINIGFLAAKYSANIPYSATKTLIIPRWSFDPDKKFNNFNISLDQGLAYERVIPESEEVTPYVNLWLLEFALRPFYYNDLKIRTKQMEDFDWEGEDTGFIGGMDFKRFQSLLGSHKELLTKFYSDRINFGFRNYLHQLTNSDIFKKLTPISLNFFDDTKKNKILAFSKNENKFLCLGTKDGSSDIYKYISSNENDNKCWENLRTGEATNLSESEIKILDGYLRAGITIDGLPFCFRELSWNRHPHQVLNHFGKANDTYSAQMHNSQKRNSMDFSLNPEDEYIGINFYTTDVNTTNTDGEEAHLKVIDDIIQSIRIVPKEKDIFDSTFFTFPRTPINYYQYKDSFETEDLSSITINAILANGQKLTATKKDFVSTSNSSSEFEDQNTLIGFNYLKNENNNYDEGYIKITLSKNMDEAAANIQNYNFNLYRDNKLLTTIKGSDLVGTSTSTTPMFTYYDFGCEQGKNYSYYLEPIKTDETTYKKIKIVDVKSDFEHITLIDDEDAASIKFNPKISTYKSNLSVSKTDTLGAQYPYIRQNGNNNYKQFSLSGLISTDVKEQKTIYRDRSWHQQDIEDIDKMYEERVYKNSMLDWLNNGKPKLLKTAQEGNYIVQLMNISLSPNDQLGRMLHTFSCEAYEVMPCTQENINKYGLFRSGFEGV